MNLFLQGSGVKLGLSVFMSMSNDSFLVTEGGCRSRCRTTFGEGDSGGVGCGDGGGIADFLIEQKRMVSVKKVLTHETHTGQPRRAQLWTSYQEYVTEQEDIDSATAVAVIQLRGVRGEGVAGARRSLRDDRLGEGGVGATGGRSHIAGIFLSLAECVHNKSVSKSQ